MYEISIVGPYNAAGAGDTPSRRTRFHVHSRRRDEDAGRVREEDSLDADAPRVSPARHRRRSQKPFELYSTAKAADGFDAGIEMGLSAVLDEPRVPVPHRAGSRARRRGYDGQARDGRIASAISSSRRGCRSSSGAAFPDDELLDVAARGDLDKPAVLEQQVTRMLADPRSESLVTNFAAQWLHLRNLDTITPDMRLFPDFDDNLRQAFRQETEMLVDSVIRENRSVLDLLRANYTFVNERLAKHYGIPNVYGSRFRRIDVRRGRAARRTAAAGQHSARHVVSDAHVAGHSRQVDSRQRARRAAASAAGRTCRRSTT